MKDNPKVYVVFYQFYDDAYIEKVFIEKETAINYVAKEEDFRRECLTIHEIQTE